MNSPEINYQAPPKELARASNLYFEELNKLYKNSLFHGTGRLAQGFDDGDKSKPNGQLVDILKAITDEGIKPQADHLAKILLPVEKTISLTKQRIYARCYAELFGADHEGQTHLQYTFGKTADWKSYFFTETAKAMKSYKNMQYLPIAIRHFYTRFSKSERKFIRGIEHHKQRWFTNKALVKGNHPLVFGLKETAISPLPLPHGLDFFETRTADIIPPTSLHLIEVPLLYINETREAVAKLGLDHLNIVPMEMGEAFSFIAGAESRC